MTPLTPATKVGLIEVQYAVFGLPLSTLVSAGVFVATLLLWPERPYRLRSSEAD